MVERGVPFKKLRTTEVDLLILVHPLPTQDWSPWMLNKRLFKEQGNPTKAEVPELERRYGLCNLEGKVFLPSGGYSWNDTVFS